MACQELGRLVYRWNSLRMALELGCFAWCTSYSVCSGSWSVVLQPVSNECEFPGRMCTHDSFLRPEVPEPEPLDTHRIHAAIVRSTETSLGSIALSSLLLTGVRLLSLLSYGMRRAPLPLLPWFTLPLRFIGNLTGALSTLALVYVGLTGDEFFPSARRSRALTASVVNSVGRVSYRREGIDRELFLLRYSSIDI